MSRRLVALVAIALVAGAAMAAAGCERRSESEGPADGAPAARIIATADHGAEVLLDERVPPGRSVLAGLTGGLAWFHLVYKPEMIRGFITAAPQPVLSVAVEEARAETWVPRAPAIGTFRAMKGVELAPQVAGVIVDISFESGQDVKAGATLVQIDDSVEQADLKANEATLRNAELALDRQRHVQHVDLGFRGGGQLFEPAVIDINVAGGAGAGAAAFGGDIQPAIAQNFHHAPALAAFQRVLLALAVDGDDLHWFRIPWKS
jgi:hypothetical protein